MKEPNDDEILRGLVRMEAQASLADRIVLARAAERIERLQKERDTWKRLCETCCEIEKQIAEHLGVEAWTTRDGEVMANVVESRLPELVGKLKQERDALATILNDFRTWIIDHHDIEDSEAGSPPHPNWAMRASDYLDRLLERKEVEL